MSIAYLSEVTEDYANKVIQVGDGLVYGDNKRTIVPLIVMDSEFAKFSLSWAAGLHGRLFQAK